MTTSSGRCTWMRAIASGSAPSRPGLAVFDAGRRHSAITAATTRRSMASDDVWSVTSTPDGSSGSARRTLACTAWHPMARSPASCPAPATPRSLPHASVGQLVVAADGTLWIGTQGGVARWTGRDFERAARQCAEFAGGQRPHASNAMARCGSVRRTGRQRAPARRPLVAVAVDPDRGRQDRCCTCCSATAVASTGSTSRPAWTRHGWSKPHRTVPLYGAVASGPVRPSWVGAHEDREGGLWFASYNSGLWYLPANWRRFAVLSRRDRRARVDRERACPRHRAFGQR